MPVKLTYFSGKERLVEGDSWQKLDESSAGRLGTIVLKSIPDGMRLIVNKSAVAEVEEIPKATWDGWIEEGKRKQEEAEAQRKKELEAQALTALEAKKLKNRVKRFLRLSKVQN
jgi:hypothetical protein